MPITANIPRRSPRFGEGYTEDGRPTRIKTLPPPTIEDTLKHGVLPFLDPLPLAFEDFTTR